MKVTKYEIATLAETNSEMSMLLIESVDLIVLLSYVQNIIRSRNLSNAEGITVDMTVIIQHDFI